MLSLRAELLQGFPEWVPGWLTLVIGRFAEGLGGSALRGADGLAAECGWEPTELAHTMGHRGLGRLETWMDRIQIYAVLRRGGEEGALQHEALHAGGFPSFGALERICAGLGVSPAAASDGREGRRHALELLLGSLQRNERTEHGHGGADEGDIRTSDLPRPVGREWWRQGEELREVAFRVARSILSEAADGDAVATQVLEKLWREFADEKAWNEVSEAFVWVSARNAAKDVLRRRARRPEWIDLDDHVLLDGEPPPPRTVADQELQETLRVGCMELRPRQRTAVWLRDLMEWPVQHMASCMDRTSASIRNLRARWRAKLQEGWVDRSTERTGQDGTSEGADEAPVGPARGRRRNLFGGFDVMIGKGGRFLDG